MKRCGVFHRIVALVLILGLAAPVVWANGGGKFYKKGEKYEKAEQWDLAAEQYALALNEDPSNGEYKLHLLRSLSKASLMFMERGKTLAEQKDYENAYQAFRQAYSYDNTNEVALSRMREMLSKLGIPLEQSDLPSDVIKSASEHNDLSRPAPPHKFTLHNYSFRDAPVNQIIRTMADHERLNIVYEDAVAKLVETKKVSFDLKNVTAPRALEIFLNAQRFGYAPIDRRTIMIFPEALANRQRYEDLMVRTFYVKNSSLDDARNVIQQAVGSKQIVPLKQLNALVVRDTPANLKLIESLLDSIDKPQSEVVLDVNLYEVSNQNMLQIGNQLNTTTDSKTPVANLSALGGFGTAASLAGGPTGGIIGGPLGLAIAAPTSVLSFLQSKTNSKLVASTQIRAFENENATVNIGSRVPVQTASIPTGTAVVNNTPTTPTTGTGGTTTPTSNPVNINTGAAFGVAQFQYVDVGLNIDVQPNVYNNYVQMKMTIESTGLAAGPDEFHPSFTQRRMKGVARIKDGDTGIVAGVMRLDNTNGRTGVPVLSFLPLVGRLFSTPTNKQEATNVVITITPHVLRSPGISDDDRLAIGPNGTANSFGANIALEELISKADEEELQTAGNNPAQQPQQPQNNQLANNQPTIQRPAVQPATGPVGVGPLPRGGNVPVNQNKTIVTQPDNAANNAANNPAPAQPNPADKPADSNRQPAPVAPPASPVSVLVRVLNPQIRVGQTGLLGVILSSNGTSLAGANLTLRFNPNVIKVTAVKDGGLLSLQGATAEFNHSEAGDFVAINANRPSGATPVPASGQLALIYFQGVGEGSADLNISEMQLMGPNGLPLTVSIVNGNIEVQGNGQPQPGQGQPGQGQPGNGQNNDDDDDE